MGGCSTFFRPTRRLKDIGRPVVSPGGVLGGEGGAWRIPAIFALKDFPVRRLSTLFAVEIVQQIYKNTNEYNIVIAYIYLVLIKNIIDLF